MATATKPPPRTDSTATAKPVIGLGPCLFYAGPGEPPAAAIVTKGGNVVSCVVFSSESRVAVPMDSVRHVDDPDNHKYVELHNGMWDYTDDQKTLKVIADRMIPDEDGFVKPIPARGK